MQDVAPGLWRHIGVSAFSTKSMRTSRQCALIPGPGRRTAATLQHETAHCWMAWTTWPQLEARSG